MFAELIQQSLFVGAWKEKDEKGKTYYYNTKTKETVWDLNKKIKENPVQFALDAGVWKEKTDDKGKKYFYNAQTRETVWDLAKKLGVGGGANNDTTPASAENNNTSNSDPVAAALASGVWKEKKDDKGKTYYYNATTKETVWDLAKKLGVASSAKSTPSAADDADPVAAALAAGIWKEKKDDKGKTYYYNTQTKETCWDLAKKLGVSAATTPSAATGDPVADALASGLWKEKKDDKGKTYYYNTQTKETCWDLAKKLGVSANVTPRAGEDNNGPPQLEKEAEPEPVKPKEEEISAEERDRRKKAELDEAARKKKKAEEEASWKPPPPPAFPPPPPSGRHPNSALPVYDTSSRRSSRTSSQMGVDPSKAGGWRNYSKTRWLEELEKRMGGGMIQTQSQVQESVMTSQDSSTSPMKSNNNNNNNNKSIDDAMTLAEMTGVISAQETLQQLTKKTIDIKTNPAAQFIDFKDGATQTIFGPSTADAAVATLHAASNIAELVPIPDAGLMSCSTLESLKREQERALVLLQHVQGSLASQMQEAGVAFTGHGSTRQLRLNISKPKTSGKQTAETEAADLAKELAPAYRSLQAPPSGPYWRFVTEHESNGLYDEASMRRARVVQQLSEGTAQRHDLFDKISKDFRDQYVLREKMWTEYSRVNAGSFVDVADFVIKTEIDLKNQRMKQDAAEAEKRLAKADDDDDFY